MIAPAVPSSWVLALPDAVRRLGERVAREHGLAFAALVGRSRLRTIVLARSRWIAITKWTLGLSYPETGRMFGGYDHTSILGMCAKTEATLAREHAA